jgi:hypothetical protein
MDASDQLAKMDDDRAERAKHVSGDDVAKWLHIVAIVLTMGGMIVGIPIAVVLGIAGRTIGATMAGCYLASIALVIIGQIAKGRDRLFGFPLKGGIWWDYPPHANEVAVGAVVQAILAFAVLEMPFAVWLFLGTENLLHACG